MIDLIWLVMMNWTGLTQHAHHQQGSECFYPHNCPDVYRQLFCPGAEQNYHSSPVTCNTVRISHRHMLIWQGKCISAAGNAAAMWGGLPCNNAVCLAPNVNCLCRVDSVAATACLTWLSHLWLQIHIDEYPSETNSACTSIDLATCPFDIWSCSWAMTNPSSWVTYEEVMRKLLPVSNYLIRSSSGVQSSSCSSQLWQLRH